MLAIMGDTHATWAGIEYLSEQKLDNFHLIQVGDFGFDKHTIRYWRPPTFPVYAICGNHENFEFLNSFCNERLDDDVIKIAENLFYIRRGSVVTIDGHKIGFLGGAHSVDEYIRKNMGMYWSPEEQVTKADSRRFVMNVEKAGGIDFMVSHTPPASVIGAVLPPLNKNRWYLPSFWEDTSAQNVEKAWESVGKPPLYCGHLHISRLYDNVKILDINEVYTIPAPQ